MLNRGQGFGDAIARCHRRFERNRCQATQGEPRPAAAFVVHTHLRIAREGVGQLQFAASHVFAPIERSGIFECACFLKACRADARNPLALKTRAEFGECNLPPNICGGGAPRAALLARHQAIDQARHIIFPCRVVVDGGDQLGGVQVAGNHQPPPVVFRFGGKAKPRAAHRHARTQYLFRLGEVFGALEGWWRIFHALQNREPIEHRAGRPDIGRNFDGLQQGRARFVAARECLNRRQFTHVQILLGRPEFALDPPFDKGDQTGFHALLRLGRHGETSFIGHRQNVGGERVVSLAGFGGEILGKAVGIQVIADDFGNFGPQLFALHAHRFGSFLLQANEGVLFKKALYPIERAGNFGCEIHRDAAAAR